MTTSPFPPLDAAGRALFGGATGMGVRVAVIDSGVHVGHPHIGRVAGGATVNPDGEIEENQFTDRLGHGTAVMAAIQEKAPDAEYFAVRVFHSSLRTSAFSLLRAIEWCVASRMDVVNLSLGSLNEDHAEHFARAAERAGQAGTLLVAAREADGRPCYPGCLASVVGVAADPHCARDRFRTEFSGGETVFHASGFPRPVPGVAPERNLHGVSFAVANMTAFVALAVQASDGRRGLAEIRQSLVRAVDTGLNSSIIGTDPVRPRRRAIPPVPDRAPRSFAQQTSDKQKR